MSILFFLLALAFLEESQSFLSPNPRLLRPSRVLRATATSDNEVIDATPVPDLSRNELWKEISRLEKEAVEMLSVATENDTSKKEEAFKLLARSIALKKEDPFIILAEEYSQATLNKDENSQETIITKMDDAGLPPHVANIVNDAIIVPNRDTTITTDGAAQEDSIESSLSDDDVDLSSTFSDTVTEKIRVKVNSFYDAEKSDPENGKFMFWYKVAIYNEGPEPVQIVARMWEIEKVGGSKETVRGAGIMSTQPIIPAGDMFTYQSVCPLKVFPPVGKRVLGSMSGAYTICKGNMGQVNFSAKVGKFNLILPEAVGALSTDEEAKDE